VALSGSLPAGGYYLVKEASGGAAGAPLPAADAIGTSDVSASTGKVAIVDGTVALSGACPVDGIIDMVGYGGTATCFETAPAPHPLGNAVSVTRFGGGCVDTDNNSQDFVTATPLARNSSSALHSCAPTLTYLADPNGTITGTTPQTVPYGGNGTPVTAVANPGYHFGFWSDGSTANPRTDTNVTADLTVTANFVRNLIVVSQVYGGGGNAGATWKNDFIELYNRGADPIDVTGWTVQYGSASGSSWTTTALSGVIPPGHYYLVQEAAGTGGTDDLPAPDATGGIAMSATSGKVALVNSATALSGACPTDATIEDLIGYGTANCAEGSPAAVLTNTTAALRNSGGCEDSDDNSADVTTGAPDPRNSSSPSNDCLFDLTVDVDPSGTGSVTRVPNQSSFVHGSSVQLTATQVSGYHFDHWSGDATGSSNPLTVVMGSDKSITAHFVPNALVGQVVISQVYGGGGNSGATYRNDYVELFNRGNIAVDVTGWTLQYASASGGTWSSTTLVGTIPAGRYYLVQEFQGSGGTDDLPTPDAVGTINLAAADGKVALVNDLALLSGTCPSGPEIVDFVGYGTANCSEASAATAGSNLAALFRNGSGCDESDDNLADFSTATPAPRNSATPMHFCSMWTAVDPATGADFTLWPPAPNPTQGPARIAFALPVDARVRLTVLDLQGRRVATLADGELSAGRHEMKWDGRDGGRVARPGIYFVRLEVPGRNLVRTVALAR
jgi:hypothetical protein